MADIVGHMTNSLRIVERIETARKADQRSVTWLSERSGIAEKTYRRRLVTPEKFTIAELSRIVDALGIQLEHVFQDDDLALTYSDVLTEKVAS